MPRALTVAAHFLAAKARATLRAKPSCPSSTWRPIAPGHSDRLRRICVGVSVSLHMSASAEAPTAPPSPPPAKLARALSSSGSSLSELDSLEQDLDGALGD
jgi:hypothetical protein